MSPLKNLKNSFLLCILFLNIFLLTGVEALPSDSGRIQRAFDEFKRLPQLENALISLSVMDAQTGELLFAENDQIGMATASTLKNITAATALDILGPDYRFSTTLVKRGDLDDQGVLHGDLVIIGTGDPSLGSDRYETTKEELILNNWVQAVQSAGIKKITGKIIADDLLWGGYQAPDAWPWADMGNYYGAGYSSLNWRENAFGVVFKPANRQGEPTGIASMTADLSYLDIRNEVITGARGSGDQVYAYAAPYSTRVFFRGSHGIDLKKTIRMSVPDPAFDLAFQLSKALERVNISAAEGIQTAYLDSSQTNTETQQKVHILHVHQSPTLAELVYWFNQSSINLYGESLLRALSQQWETGLGTGSAARKLAEYWSEKMEIPRGELRIVDGSGLSPNNRVTTGAMVKILTAIQQESWFPAFYESIPINNGMKLKSGTISGVLGYAGYHTASDGREYVVSILLSNYEGGAAAMRRQMFRLLDVLK